MEGGALMKISPKTYEEKILESMARTLWATAYADWTEELSEEDEDALEYQVPRAEDGDDWMEEAPPTPIAAVHAARELRDLIMADNRAMLHGNRLRGELHGLYDLFAHAMEVDLGRPFPSYDEPWHSQIEADPKDTELLSVYADWLEEQGRIQDADFVRTAATYTSRPYLGSFVTDKGGKAVLEFMGGLDAATAFGHDIAMQCLGMGVAWSDDHVTKRGDLVFDPVLPSFECHYDGEQLLWSGRVRDPDARPSTKSYAQTARFRGEDPPLTEILGGTNLSTGQRRLLYINENDRDWTRHRYVLWAGQAGPSYFVIHANSLEDALDEMGDWLRDNAPGLLATESVNEEYKRLEKEWLEENEGTELDDETRWQLMEEAEQDTTPLGGYGDRIGSDDWGIVAEDPSDVELLKIAGLIENGRHTPHPKSTSFTVKNGVFHARSPFADPFPYRDNPKRQSPYDELATVMFRNTVTARMLRELAERKQMPQGEFMQHYMRRCERAPSKWVVRDYERRIAGTGQDEFKKIPEPKATPSSFVNNFGRFVVWVNPKEPLLIWPDMWGSAWGHPTSMWQPDPPDALHVIGQTGSSKYSQRNDLVWVGPSIDNLLKNMSIQKLDWAYANLEQQLVDKARATDDPEETKRWLDRVQQYLHRTPVRTNPRSRTSSLHAGRPTRSKVTHAHHPVPRKR